jgi:phosphatidylserine decarboxylase
VTIIQTDIPGGTGVGLVAMVEVVALGIGGIKQCYSTIGYEDPQRLETGMFIQKGVPKSLYQPGSSTNVLLFQKNRIQFTQDLISNLNTAAVDDYFTTRFGKPLVETDIRVRSTIAYPCESSSSGQASRRTIQ